jgi:hypothetical protein
MVVAMMIKTNNNNRSCRVNIMSTGGGLGEAKVLKTRFFSQEGFL